MDLKPGFETTTELWSCNKDHMKRFCDKHIIPFLRIRNGANVLDFGEKNPRSQYLSEQLNLRIRQVEGDFNSEHLFISPFEEVVFIFEVLEHLQNPLHFMDHFRVTNYRIYVIMPCNPRWLWHEKHFFEMNRKHFEKWIVIPAGLKIVRYKKIISVTDWRVYFIGLRPLIRLLTGKTKFRDFLRAMFYVQYGIYEIRKA